MTSEEIYSNIKQLTGIPQNHNMVRMAAGLDCNPESTDNLVSCPIFVVFKVDEEQNVISINVTKGGLDNCIKNETFNKVIFNPYALSLGLLIWMNTKPDNQNTKNMLFSAFNWLDCPTNIGDLYKAVSEDPIPYLRKYLDKYDYIRTHNGNYPRAPHRRRQVRDGENFDVNISDTESGRAAYWCRRDFSSVFFDSNIISDIQQAEDNDDAIAIIEEYLLENYTNGDADEYNDYEYEDHEFHDTEDYFNHTDMDELLEQIRSYQQ